MPFISKDWRSPGEEWVKTKEGWEKRKVLECSSLLFDNEKIDDRKEVESEQFKDSAIQPYCHITKASKEIAGFTGLSDALKRLDWKAAVRDRRRFKYICKLLDLLCSERPLSDLPGGVQKVLFTMLEEVAHQIRVSQENTAVLRRLIVRLRALVECACWGRPLGSAQLWQHHLAVIHRINHIANTLKIQQPEVSPKFEDMPEECVREVLLRLGDHKDIEAFSDAWPVPLSSLVPEHRLWRELVAFHFTEPQIRAYLMDRGAHRPIDWRQVFHALRKTCGLREDYAEMIQLCRTCRCLFWSASGHPCIADDPSFSGDPSVISVPPQDFLKFFSL